MFRKNKNVLNLLSLVLIAVIVVFSFYGCSNEVSVKITDYGVSTEVKAQTGETIESILSNNNIKVSSKDEVTPHLDETLTKETKEILVKRYAMVKVIYNADVHQVELVGGTVEDAIKKSKIEISGSEKIEPEKSKYLQDGMDIFVGNTMSITLDFSSEKIKYITTAKTIKELKNEINKRKIISDEFILDIDENSKISDGMSIKIKLVNYKEITEKETIKYSTITKYSNNLSSGEKEITQEGKNGEKEVVYKVKYVDGKEDSREVISEKIITEAKDEIITYGSENNEIDDKYSSQDSGNIDQGSGDSGQDAGGRVEVSRQAYYDCDGSGHGYYEVTYSDGSVEYIDF